MKPVFKCDYCSKMGTEEEIREHEPKCFDNYDRRNCNTCANKKFSFKNSECVYECKAGKSIPSGKMYEFCDSYIREIREINSIDGLFGNMFSGF